MQIVVVDEQKRYKQTTHKNNHKRRPVAWTVEAPFLPPSTLLPHHFLFLLRWEQHFRLFHGLLRSHLRLLVNLRKPCLGR